jgi:hypothetical protein
MSECLPDKSENNTNAGCEQILLGFLLNFKHCSVFFPKWRKSLYVVYMKHGSPKGLNYLFVNCLNYDKLGNELSYK